MGSPMGDSIGEREVMTCAEFQKVLPYIIESGGNADEEAHLRSCPVCSDLVSDLKYIAEQAKLLVPMMDPPARVWTGIQTELEREGLKRPAGTAAGLAPVLFVPGRRATAARLGAIAALLALAIGLILYRSAQAPPPPVAETPEAPAANAAQTGPMQDAADDQRVLATVAARNPAARERYRKHLDSVNAAIRDARSRVQQDPADADAQDILRNAYDQKALIYQMATSRSLQ